MLFVVLSSDLWLEVIQNAKMEEFKWRVEDGLLSSVMRVWLRSVVVISMSLPERQSSGCTGLASPVLMGFRSWPREPDPGNQELKVANYIYSHYVIKFSLQWLGLFLSRPSVIDPFRNYINPQTPSPQLCIIFVSH